MAFNSPGEPFSVPDPLGEAWDDMAQRNRRLQAQNDPLSLSDADAAQLPTDPAADALNGDSLPMDDWQRLREAQAAGDDAMSFAGGDDSLAGGAGDDTLGGRPTLSPQQIGPGRQAQFDGDIAAGHAPGGLADAARRVVASLFGETHSIGGVPPAAPSGQTAAPGALDIDAIKRARALENGGSALGALVARGEGTDGPDGYDKFYGQGWKKTCGVPPSCETA